MKYVKLMEDGSVELVMLRLDVFIDCALIKNVSCGHRVQLPTDSFFLHVYTFYDWFS